MAKKTIQKISTLPKSEPLKEVIQQPERFVPWQYVFVFLLACLVYSNTLWNLYAIDDVIVVTDNRYTKKGTAGIGEHFTHDMFEGFFGERGAKLVSGGRYRPLSMTTFAIEYEIMRKLRGDKRAVIDEKNIIIGDNDPFLNPMLGHAINILLFALTGVVLLLLLRLFMPKGPSIHTPIGPVGIPLIATLLYVVHPIHTEAVANIKGRDEVMCMLFSLMALFGSFKYVQTKNVMHLLWASVVFFIALLSKENAITFLAVVPLVYYFFTKATPKEYGLATGAFLFFTIVFLLLRNKYTQAGLTQDSPEILNNPFLLATPVERYATAIYTFVRYYWLMVFPHPLTHDYYYNQIPYVNLQSGGFWLSFLITAGLVVYALLNLKKKSAAAFGILFFFITFSVASNILFTVGVLMNERFIYMSSLGFCIMLPAAVLQIMQRLKVSPQFAGVFFAAVLTLYSVKTFSRNYDWKDSFRLFRVDSHYSTNSAKIQTSLGGDLTKAALSDISAFRDSGEIKRILTDLRQGNISDQELNAFHNLPDSMLRKILLDSAITHLNQAIRIYPTHSNAWLLLGNAMYQRTQNAAEVIPVYENAAAYRVGGYYDAYFNLGIVYNDANQPAKAKASLLKAFEMKPEAMECRFLLAQSYAKLNEPDSVLYWLGKAEEIKPLSAHDYYLVGTAYGKNAFNFPMAINYLKKAVALNPKAELYREDLGVAYGLNKQYDEAISTASELIALNPKYPAAYMNLSVSHRMKGNVKLADEYLRQYNELISALKQK